MEAEAEASSKYTAHGSLAQIEKCTADELIVAGPAGTGKSRACLERIHELARNNKNSRYLIVRKTRESLTESALFTLETYVFGEEYAYLWQGVQRRMRQSYRYRNGAEIVLGGMDKPTKVMSTEYDLIYVQEATELTEEDWESLSSRLRNGKLPFQQLMADCNPDRPTHWLKRRADAGRAVMIESRHTDNPVLWDEIRQEWTERGKQYIGRLDQLTGARFWRLRHGRWVQSEGVIYEGWDTAKHVIDRFEIPEDWLRFRSVDFGFTNPFVCGWWALDDDGRMYLYRELYHTKRTVRAHAEQIQRLERWWLQPDDVTEKDMRENEWIVDSDGWIVDSDGHRVDNPNRERIAATVCDHDAEDRATLEEHDIWTTAANKAVSVGIQTVQERLRTLEDGKARLYIMRDSLAETDSLLEEAKKPLCTEHEFDGYVWSNKANKEEPVKLDDHGMDMTRYAAMFADNPRTHGGIFV